MNSLLDFARPVALPKSAKRGFLEFFAGSGMVRLGMGKSWTCLFANDFCEDKCASYSANFGWEELFHGDISSIDINQLPESALFAWASFPCQDLSLAGWRNGLGAKRSGTFWTFWNHIKALEVVGRKVPIIALENVVGLLSSAGGKDFGALIETICESYQVGAMVMDAIHWLPQSRPRLVIIAVSKDVTIPAGLVCQGPRAPWHPTIVQRAFDSLSPELRANWLWWDMPTPPPRAKNLGDIIECTPKGVKWDSPESTARLLELMSPANRAKVRAASTKGIEVIGTVYKRTRTAENGVRHQRAEVRFDGISGCLRTPSGGSSRQTILVVNGESIKSRLLSPREAARLMGLPESYILPTRYNDAYRLAGDGVAVPVVEWLERHILYPLSEVVKL